MATIAICIVKRNQAPESVSEGNAHTLCRRARRQRADRDDDNRDRREYARVGKPLFRPTGHCCGHTLESDCIVGCRGCQVLLTVQFASSWSPTLRVIKHAVHKPALPQPVFECGPHRFEYRALAAVESPTDVAPAQRAASVPFRSAGEITLRDNGPIRSPDFCGASSVSTNTRAWRKQSSSASRHLRREASDKIEMRSRFQPRAAYDRLGGERRAAHDIRARHAVRQTGDNGRIETFASQLLHESRGRFRIDVPDLDMCDWQLASIRADGTRLATRPAPNSTMCEESSRARKVVVSAEAAAVRREVISLPSICASGSPVPASYST